MAADDVDPTAIEVFSHYYRLVESGGTGMIREADIEPLREAGVAQLFTPGPPPRTVPDRPTEENPGAFQPNQYFNQENPNAHYATTGPEIWRPTDGNWHVQGTAGNYFAAAWGQTGDIPAQGDYDGDGRTDLVVFRPSEGKWYLLQTTAGFLIQQFGVDGGVLRERTLDLPNSPGQSEDLVTDDEFG